MNRPDLALFTVLGFATPALAQTPGPTATPTTAHPHAATPLVQAIARGSDAYHRHDYDAALAAFRDAASIDPQGALPVLYLAYVTAARGDLAGALSGFREAAARAGSTSDDPTRARALTEVAMTLEGLGHWDEARTAWREAGSFAESHADVGYPATARARTTAIRGRDDMEQQYAPVRQRIADRLRANAAGQGAAGDAAAGGVPVPVHTSP